MKNGGSREIPEKMKVIYAMFSTQFSFTFSVEWKVNHKWRGIATAHIQLWQPVIEDGGRIHQDWELSTDIIYISIFKSSSRKKYLNELKINV